MVGGWLLGLAVVASTGWAFEAWRADSGRRRSEMTEGLEPELTEAAPKR